MKLDKICDCIRYIRIKGNEPGMIILNEDDARKLANQLVRGYKGILNPAPITLFGIKLVIIPRYLKDSKFLKLGKALILEKRWVDFLKKELK